MSIIGEPHLDWGNHGDQCWEVWKVEPCCGRPFNLKDCCYCCTSLPQALLLSSAALVLVGASCEVARP